mmetsp:Transcript_99003/g.255960  ORF Transcript_99003/g.255960 Transcript_99003/m.255960 type:complete len:98 (-) Transcript_99003:467-760(-)
MRSINLMKDRTSHSSQTRAMIADKAACNQGRETASASCGLPAMRTLLIGRRHAHHANQRQVRVADKAPPNRSTGTGTDLVRTVLAGMSATTWTQLRH